jgi:hypothetical protein
VCGVVGYDMLQCVCVVQLVMLCCSVCGAVGYDMLKNLRCIWLRYYAVFLVKLVKATYLWYSWLRHHPEMFMVPFLKTTYRSVIGAVG